MTALEERLYLALLGARTIVAATAAVNPKAQRILNLVDRAATLYKDAKSGEEAIEAEVTDDAAGE